MTAFVFQPPRCPQYNLFQDETDFLFSPSDHRWYSVPSTLSSSGSSSLSTRCRPVSFLPSELPVYHRHQPHEETYRYFFCSPKEHEHRYNEALLLQEEIQRQRYLEALRKQQEARKLRAMMARRRRKQEEEEEELRRQYLANIMLQEQKQKRLQKRKRSDPSWLVLAATLDDLLSCTSNGCSAAASSSNGEQHYHDHSSDTDSSEETCLDQYDGSHDDEQDDSISDNDQEDAFSEAAENHANLLQDMLPKMSLGSWVQHDQPSANHVSKSYISDTDANGQSNDLTINPPISPQKLPSIRHESSSSSSNLHPLNSYKAVTKKRKNRRKRLYRNTNKTLSFLSNLTTPETDKEAAIPLSSRPIKLFKTDEVKDKVANGNHETTKMVDNIEELVSNNNNQQLSANEQDCLPSISKDVAAQKLQSHYRRHLQSRLRKIFLDCYAKLFKLRQSLDTVSTNLASVRPVYDKDGTFLHNMQNKEILTIEEQLLKLLESCDTVSTGGSLLSILNSTSTSDSGETETGSETDGSVDDSSCRSSSTSITTSTSTTLSGPSWTYDSEKWWDKVARQIRKDRKSLVKEIQKHLTHIDLVKKSPPCLNQEKEPQQSTSQCRGDILEKEEITDDTHQTDSTNAKTHDNNNNINIINSGSSGPLEEKEDQEISTFEEGWNHISKMDIDETQELSESNNNNSINNSSNSNCK